MKKLIFAFLILLLQGCAGGLIIAAGTAVAVSSDERTLAEQIDDKTISRHARDKIKALNIPPEDLRISLVTNSGYLLIVGQVRDQKTKNAIDKKLSTLKNVKDIYNQLHIGEPIGLAQQSRDSWITAKVKSQFTAHDDIDPLKIKVVTENAEVYLIGLVSEEMAKDATNATRKVEGVKQVNRVFQLLDAK